ncbi:MAG: hypothetical protein ACOZDD_07080 [Bacteroidota bacterium]
MRFKEILKISGAILMVVSMVSCDMLRTAEQDVEAVVSPDKNPKVTYTANITGNSVTEGQKFIYTIKLDKPIDRALTFSAMQTGGTAVEEEDFLVSPVILQPYTTEAKLEIEIIADDYPEVEETASFEIGIFGIAERYLINPESTNPIKLDLKLVNKNDPGKLTIAFEWPDHSVDLDIVIWSDTEDYPMTEWGDAGATGNNPEIDKSIWLADPPGTYYVNIMDWDEDPFTYKFSIGHPNGTVQFIEGTFDRTKNTYVNDLWTAWGGKYDSFRVLKVVHTGTSFTVTKL